MADRLLDLGHGLAIYRFDVDELVEQDVNARTMKKEAFDRLTATIASDERLEQLPFIALAERDGKQRFEIVGGHHRVRSARTAGVTEVYGIVDDTGLTRDKIAAKQLAHNAIQGYDDPQLVARIFESIGDVDARLEAFIDPASVDLSIPRIKIEDVELGMRFETVIVMFIPWEKEFVRDALTVIEHELVGTNSHEAWLADLAHFEDFKKVGRRITREYDIHTTSTLLAKMAELALRELGQAPPADPDDVVSVRDLAGAFWLPADAAATIAAAVARYQEDRPADPPWRAMERWAADYLGRTIPQEVAT